MQGLYVKCWIFALLVWAQATSMLRNFDQNPSHVCNLVPAGHAHQLLCPGSGNMICMAPSISTGCRLHGSLTDRSVLLVEERVCLLPSLVLL
jgi:hypothetical protein